MGTYLNTARRVFERLKVGSVSSGSGNQSVSPPSTYVATLQEDDVPLSANTTKTTLTTKPPSFTATSGTTKTTNPHTSTTETTKPPDSTTETTKPRSSTTKTAKPQVAPSWSALQFARQRAESDQQAERKLADRHARAIEIACHLLVAQRDRGAGPGARGPGADFATGDRRGHAAPGGVLPWHAA